MLATRALNARGGWPKALAPSPGAGAVGEELQLSLEQPYKPRSGNEEFPALEASLLPTERNCWPAQVLGAVVRQPKVKVQRSSASGFSCLNAKRLLIF